MNNPVVRVGILGCASIARRSLVPAFAAHSSFSVAAVASRTCEKAAELARTCGARPTTYDELVSAPDVDLVYCPLPTGLHHFWVKRCLLAGKHVLCEKSLACTAAEAFELVELARARGLFLMESFQFRFHAQNVRVRQLLDSGKIGKIRQVSVRFGFPPFPDGPANIRYHRELGGGALLDAGAYAVKATQFILGPQLEVVSASSWTDPGAEVDLGGSISFRASDGAVSHAAYGFDNFYRCGYDIWGSRGVISTTRAFTARSGFHAPVSVETDEGTTVETFDDDHFARMLDHVAASIRAGTFETELEDCRLQAALLQAAREAAS